MLIAHCGACATMTVGQRVYLQSPPWLQTVLLNAHAWRIGRHRYGSSYRAAVARLLEQEQWAPERIREYQDARTRTIVDLAYRGTAYYRRLLDAAGVRPADIPRVAHLPQLPLLTSDVVRTRGRELMTRRPARGWLHGHTS